MHTPAPRTIGRRTTEVAYPGGSLLRAGPGQELLVFSTTEQQDGANGPLFHMTLIVDGEPFWGSDRLDQIDKWLATGGW